MARFDLTDARALTLLNPWAYAITDLGKRVENRTWSAPQSLDVLLIHAGKGWDKNAPKDLTDVARRWTKTSAIVAVAQLAHCCDCSIGSSEVICACGEWAAAAQYHWRLADNIAVLSEPVPCGGALGLWRPKPSVLAAVREQVA